MWVCTDDVIDECFDFVFWFEFFFGSASHGEVVAEIVADEA